jgi:hypothetical protein
LKKETLKKLFTVLRIFVAVALILFLVWRLDISKILKNISGLEIIYLFYALIAYFVFVVVSAWRWQVLLDFKEFGIPFGRTLVIYFIAFFFNNFLPTTIGGDIMKVLYATKKRKADALATVLVDRVLGFVGLFIFLLLIVMYYLLVARKQTEFLSFTIIGLIIVGVITYIFFSERAYSIFSPIGGKIIIFKLGERLNHLHETATDFGGAWGPITLCIAHSIVIQALLAIAPFYVMLSMGNFDIGVLPFFIYVPVINVISMIPVAPNAIGVRENSYVLLFSRVGLSGETAFTISIVAFFLTVLASLVGGIFFIFYKRR